MMKSSAVCVFSVMLFFLLIIRVQAGTIPEWLEYFPDEIHENSILVIASEKAVTGNEEPLTGEASGIAFMFRKCSDDSILSDKFGIRDFPAFVVLVPGKYPVILREENSGKLLRNIVPSLVAEKKYGLPEAGPVQDSSEVCPVCGKKNCSCASDSPIFRLLLKNPLNRILKN